MNRRRNPALVTIALAVFAVGVVTAFEVPRGIGPGSRELARAHPGVAVKTFDSRWIPVTLQHADILEALRELRLETSTMWFRVDCSDFVYERHEIATIFQGGTVWVAAGHPKPTAPPARCLEGEDD